MIAIPGSSYIGQYAVGGTQVLTPAVTARRVAVAGQDRQRQPTGVGQLRVASDTYKKRTAEEA